jgi:hypothetical protein
MNTFPNNQIIFNILAFDNCHRRGKFAELGFNTLTPVILLVLPILMVFKEREFIISHKTRTILIYYIR